MSGTDPQVPQQLLERKAAEATSKRRELTDELDKASHTEAVWKRLLEAQKSCHPAEVVCIIRRESDLFKELRQANDDAVPVLESLYRYSEEKARNVARRFATLFPEACDEMGLGIDPTSRHPKYTIRDFIHTLVDERNLVAQVTPRDANPVTIPLDIDPLVTHLQTEVRRLFEAKRNSEHFLGGLKKAYHAVLREDNRTLGDELPLRRVANRFSKNRAHFRYDEFNVDLGNIVRSGRTVVDNVRLHLNHTRDTRQGMLLFGLERSGYLGFISFKPEEPQ